MARQELLAETLCWESEEFFRLITASIRDAIFVTDFEGNLVFASRRAEEISGYRAEEFLGRGLWSILTPETRALSRARLDAPGPARSPRPSSKARSSGRTAAGCGWK